MKRKNKGFTLIELLAVIVILGLLMAIAIPSVTKYITQSRKKTLTTTIGNYISALTNQVNDMEYIFTESNTVYAVPIECIALERGGTNPFGEWMQASNSYWAYVLVQYDDATSSYTYGFTFKDSAGYGLYPTTIEKLNENGSQINTNLDLRRFVTGSYFLGANEENWNGFNINKETKVKVLKSELEGHTGDGVNTCTLTQKGANYDKILEENKDMTIMKTDHYKAFWQYRESIKTITFQNYINIPDDAYESWDVSNKRNGMVMAYIKKNPSNTDFYDLYIQSNGEIYANPNSSQLFSGFSHVDSINNIDILNTSNVTNMSRMFYNTGSLSSVFRLDLGSNFNTKNVTNMSYMFFGTGKESANFTLNLGNNFYTSKVTNMSYMFSHTGLNSTKFTLNLGDNFDTSNVSNMSWMFRETGYYCTVFTLDLGNKFNTKNVTSMEGMFYYLGWYNENFKLDLGSNFDTSNVTNMNVMFHATGYLSKTFTLNLGNKFNTKNVTNMNHMLDRCGVSSSIFQLDCSNWNVDNVTTHTDFNRGITSKVIAPIWKN